MTTQETITKLIEKYEGELNRIEEMAEILPQEVKYYMGKASCYLSFLTDLKELQNTINK